MSAGKQIGYDSKRNRKRFTFSDEGIVEVPKGHVFS
ncbi:hypothetical protein [Solemya pervernicosa gill symbiont]